MSTIEERRRWFDNFVEAEITEHDNAGDIKVDEPNGILAGHHWEPWVFVVDVVRPLTLDRTVEDYVNNADDHMVQVIDRYCVLVKNDSHQACYPLFDADLAALSRTLATLTDAGDTQDDAFAMGVWDLETGNALRPHERHYYTFEPTESSTPVFGTTDLDVP